ncbi:MAG: DUF5074 domain-containing protein [Bacteroidia bacterium]|nr:DUF5074 domain-containing protein [Bacteroidia bacterium]MCZ2248463.1 DUF5074 domain-containing protein [Bacteroidia bacterium]
MKNNIVTAVLWSLFILSLGACKSDKPKDEIKPALNMSGKHGFYIINEGNFQFGNASISYYNPEDKTFIEDIYKTINKTGIGDVCQSMTNINGWYYVVVNNSKKIEIINPENFERKQSITGLLSPRYIVAVSNAKAYVSDFKSNCLHIINTISNSKQGEIVLPGWTEEMIVQYGKVYVTNMTYDKLYVVNAANDAVEDSLVLAQSPGSLVQDKEGKIWVLCQGDNTMGKNAALFCINPFNLSIEKRMDFAANQSPIHLRINSQADTLYFINKHVYRMSVSDNSLPTQEFINGNNHNFYGLNIEPKTDNIYVADAIDYIQKGTIYAYNRQGQNMFEVKSGLIPSKVFFERQ